MINIEDIEEVSRLAIQAKTNETWYTVHNFPINTKFREALLELNGWRENEPDGIFRLISADIIVKIETIDQI